MKPMNKSRRLDYTEPGSKRLAGDDGNEVADRDTGKRGYTLDENPPSNVEMDAFLKSKPGREYELQERVFANLREMKSKWEQHGYRDSFEDRYPEFAKAIHELETTLTKG